MLLNPCELEPCLRKIGRRTIPYAAELLHTPREAVPSQLQLLDCSGGLCVIGIFDRAAKQNEQNQ